MKIKPCVIGLGYVGLPVLVNLSKKFNPCGFDINKNRILNLKKNLDKTKEFTKKELAILRNAKLTSKFNELKNCNFFIVCVPTPININKHPDLRPLKIACKIIGKAIKKNDIIVFESTVYPGTTRDICVPIIETYSKLSISKKEFFVCYSPERVNPGDKKHSLKRINKIIAIPEKKILKDIKKVYQYLSKKLIITKKIEETETAKVIENIQRDINIALANEIYIFCKKLNLNFKEVLKLAASKWNFIKFSPGLVGGHCLPVDPYYFSYVAKKNMKTNITLAGRNTNEYMKYFVINEIKKELKK
jgi:UDP-N-acetyl-D-galactosamine dehydrogenase